MREQGVHGRVRGPPGERGADLAAPPGQLGRRHARVGDVVGDVVDLAAEGIEGRDRGAAWRRQEQERVVEARPARRGLLLDVLLRAHGALGRSRNPGVPRSARARRGRIDKARHAIHGASRQPRIGRVARVAPCRRSVRSRMRSPPCTTRRSSQAGAARQGVHQRGAGEHQSARPGDQVEHHGVHLLAVAAGQDLAAARPRNAGSRRAGHRACRGARRRRGPARSWPAAVPCRWHPSGRAKRRHRPRTDAGAVGRPGSPSGGNRPAARRGRRSSDLTTSCSNASSKAEQQVDREPVPVASGRPRARIRTGHRSDAGRPAATAARSARKAAQGLEARLAAARRLRRRCRRPSARSRRWPRPRGAAPAGTARTPPESSRSACPLTRSILHAPSLLPARRGGWAGRSR